LWVKALNLVKNYIHAGLQDLSVAENRTLAIAFKPLQQKQEMDLQ
jgi:hypothetical protein